MWQAQGLLQDYLQTSQNKTIAEQNAKANVARGLTGHPDSQEY